MTEVFIMLILGLILIALGQKILQKSKKAHHNNILFIVGMIVLWIGIICCVIVWGKLQIRLNALWFGTR